MTDEGEWRQSFDSGVWVLKLSPVFRGEVARHEFGWRPILNGQSMGIYPAVEPASNHDERLVRRRKM